MQVSMPENLTRPSTALKQVSARLVANSYLMHSTGEERVEFYQNLNEALDSNDRVALLVLGGLREAGLDYTKKHNDIRIQMRHPRLSSPDSADFSSKVISALDYGHVIEVLTEKGREMLKDPDQMTDMQEWIENMEIAIHNDVPAVLIDNFNRGA